MNNVGVVDQSKRQFLTSALTVVGAVGAGFIAVPFLAQMQPSTKAEAAGAPVEVDISKPKVELLLEMHKPENDEKYIEYLPFLGITSVRLRILVNQPVKKLIIRPKIFTKNYAENIEWSNYICGINNENTDHDITKGFIALFGGGKTEGFVMFNPPAESYAFFFLRHHDKKLKQEILPVLPPIHIPLRRLPTTS